MSRPIPWPWLLLLLLLLLPGPAGRFLLDLLGGLTLTLLALPLLAGIAGVIGWQLLRQRLRTCANCGSVSFATTACPACGASFEQDGNRSRWAPEPVEIDPRTATITIEAVDVPAGESGADAGTGTVGSRPEGHEG